MFMDTPNSHKPTGLEKTESASHWGMVIIGFTRLGSTNQFRVHLRLGVDLLIQ
jgi:hypothetical protein